MASELVELQVARAEAFNCRNAACLNERLRLVSGRIRDRYLEVLCPTHLGLVGLRLGRSELLLLVLVVVKKGSDGA